jgi:hypothetical protein
MVSFKIILATLPFALQALALPAGSSTPLELDSRLVCLAPTNCSPIGNCEYCCASGTTPNSSTCHSHGGGSCAAGQTQYHCDDDH